MSMYIKNKVDQLVKKYQTRDPFELIKGMNVILVRCSLDGVRGFYQYFQRNNIIYLDDQLPEKEQFFVLAHELGHMFLHKKSNAIFMDTHTCFNTDKLEREANTFAAELLIPDTIIMEKSDFTLEQLARLTGYTEDLLKCKRVFYEGDFI